MTLSAKQEILAYFKTKAEEEVTTVCAISGISFTIIAPELPPIADHLYVGLSPLADKDAAETLGRFSFSSIHHDMAPSTLAGILLSLLHHYELRKDKLSAVEANVLLSQLPIHELSKACNFLAYLTEHEKKRIPRLSLHESNPSILKGWLRSAQAAVNIDIFEPLETTQTKKPIGKGMIDSSVTIEERKQARELLKALKEANILPTKLYTVIHMSIQKNNLALIGSDLRKKIVGALGSYDVTEAQALAKIFSDAGKKLTNQDAIVAKQMEEGHSIFSGTDTQVPYLRLTLAEIIAKKKAELLSPTPATKSEIVSTIEELSEEVDAEIEEDLSVETEYLVDEDEVRLAEAGIHEIDLEVDSLPFTSDPTLEDRISSLDDAMTQIISTEQDDNEEQS